MYSSDGEIIYFDNHKMCDSFDLYDHLNKIGELIDSGNVEHLEYEIIRAFENDNSVCLIVKFIYPSRREPSVRTTFYLEKEESELKIRHIHCSFNPNEEKNRISP